MNQKRKTKPSQKHMTLEILHHFCFLPQGEKLQQTIADCCWPDGTLPGKNSNTLVGHWEAVSQNWDYSTHLEENIKIYLPKLNWEELKRVEFTILAHPVRGGRHSGRQRAFEVLYALNYTPVKNSEELEQVLAVTPVDGDVSPGSVNSQKEFSKTLVLGVWENQSAIDETIGRHSTHWKTKRIALVDMIILRLALYEMLFAANTPTRVVINEAVDLAKGFGSENSQKFVNGILDAIAKTKNAHQGKNNKNRLPLESLAKAGPKNF